MGMWIIYKKGGIGGETEGILFANIWDFPEVD
jgi:hypothetical protein